MRRVILALGLSFFALFLLLPLATVFTEALRKGFGVYLAAIAEPDALSALRLTLLAAAIAVPLNLVFGVAAAWAVTKFDFTGKSLLMTLIDDNEMGPPCVPARRPERCRFHKHVICRAHQRCTGLTCVKA